MVLRDTITPTRRLRRVGIIVMLAALVLLSNWLRQTPLFINATTHQPERYTELYFTNPADLTSTTRNGQILPVSFTIHNVEAQDMTYTYRTDFINPSGQTITLNQQQFSLPNGSTQEITNNVTLPVFSGRAEISVALLHQPEAIHFWLVGSS